MNIREKFNLKFSRDDYELLGEKTSMTVEEVSKFTDMPKKDTNNTDIPNELTNGDICIGTTVKNGEKVNVYFNSEQYYDRGLLVAGKMGSGKTLYLQNYINDCVKKGDSVVVLDYIKHSDLTSNIKEIIPEDKLVVLDFENVENLQSLSYNELNYTNNMSKNDKMRVIYDKAWHSLKLLNILNDKELSYSAKRYFLSVSSIVYAVDNSASIKDIVSCLTDQNTRMDYINRIPKDLKEMLEDEINTALRLNNISSSVNSVEEILDTTYLIKESMQANFMLKKSSENNISFEKCFDEGKVVCIKIDDDTLNGSNLKDMLSLFFVTKAYLACKNRVQSRFELNPSCKLNTVHLIIDEVNSLRPNTLKEINNNLLCCIRPYYLKPVLTTQNLLQLPNNVLKNISVSGFNYMFLSGIDKSTYRLLELNCPNNIDELNNIEKYHSVNLILGYKGYYEPFVTELPSKLEVL